MKPYTDDEYMDVLLMDGECSRNVREAAREDTIRHPRLHIFPVVEGIDEQLEF